MQGCTAPPVNPARQDKHNITSFPEASKISSSFGQNLATPQATGREPGQEPVTPQSAGNGCRSSGACTDTSMGWESGSACTAQGTGTESCLPGAPLLCVCPLHPLLWQHELRICSFLTCAFPSCLKLRSTASTAPCRHPHGLRCSWSGLSWLPINIVHLIPRVLLVSSIIDPAFPC